MYRRRLETISANHRFLWLWKASNLLSNLSESVIRHSCSMIWVITLKSFFTEMIIVIVGWATFPEFYGFRQFNGFHWTRNRTRAFRRAWYPVTSWASELWTTLKFWGFWIFFNFDQILKSRTFFVVSGTDRSPASASASPGLIPVSVSLSFRCFGEN